MTKQKTGQNSPIAENSDNTPENAMSADSTQYPTDSEKVERGANGRADHDSNRRKRNIDPLLEELVRNFGHQKGVKLYQEGVVTLDDVQNYIALREKFETDEPTTRSGYRPSNLPPLER